jgi:hypothetical protein
MENLIGSSWESSKSFKFTVATQLEAGAKNVSMRKGIRDVGSHFLRLAARAILKNLTPITVKGTWTYYGKLVWLVLFPHRHIALAV